MNLATLYASRYLPHIRRHLKPRTVAEYERLWATLLNPRLGARPLTELTLDDAEALHAETPGKVQANRVVSLLSGILSYAVRRRLLAVHPCRGVERNREQGREFFYDKAQSKRLLRAASVWDDIRARYIALTLLVGARPGELLESAPTWRHGSVLRTPDGKTGSRVIFLPPAACAILDALTPQAKVSGHYFPEKMDLRRAWDRLCRDAKVPRVRMYDLRHTFASAALAAGESLAVVGQMLGHRKAQTTLRYVHLEPEIGLRGAAAAARRMGA